MSLGEAGALFLVAAIVGFILASIPVSADDPRKERGQ
jgi:hypothetical protein